MKKPKEQGKQESENFDQQLELLRSLVDRLEHGGLTLDDSLKTFEQGIGVSRNLFTMLNEAEGKIEELLANMEKMPFDKSEE